MSSELTLSQIRKEWHGSLKAYALGFVLSLILTGASFLLVLSNALSGIPLVFALTTLAAIQAAVQLLFFLHLGQEAKPRWETMVFYFMVLIVFIVAIGTLWVMYDLDNRVMPMEQMNHTNTEHIHD